MLIDMVYSFGARSFFLGQLGDSSLTSPVLLFVPGSLVHSPAVQLLKADDTQPKYSRVPIQIYRLEEDTSP